MLNSAKLRARQKERLAQRNAIEDSRTNDRMPGFESHPPQCPPINAKDGEPATGLVQSVKEKSLIIDLEDNNPKSDSPIRLGRLSKNKLSNHLDLSVNPLDHPSPDIYLSRHQLHEKNYTNSALANNFLPVLGLCAPHANQIESSHRNFSRSNGKQSRAGAGPEFPFSLAPQSGSLIETEVKDLETLSNRVKISDASTDILHQHLKSSYPDGCLPFSLVVFQISLCPPLSL